MKQSSPESKTPIIEKLKEQFKNIDAFGQPITFFYEGEDQFKSYFGASLTLVVLVLVLFLSMTIIKAAIWQTDVSFNSDALYMSEPGTLKMTTQDFHIALLIDDVNHNFDNSMVGLRMRWANYTRLPDGTLLRPKITIPLRYCRSEDFAEFPDAFVAYRLGSALCPEPADIPLSGTFLSDVFQFIEILAEECDDSIHAVSSIKCAPETDRTNYFSKNKVKVQIYFKNYNVVPSNIDKPFQPYMDNLFYVINQGTLAKSVDVFIQPSELKSQENFFISEKEKTQSRYAVDKAAQDQVYTPTKDPLEYLSVQMRISQMQLLYSRQLTGIADIAAYFGGIWGMLYGLSSIFAAAHNNIGYQKSLADKIFRFDSYIKGNDPKRHNSKDKDAEKSKKKLPNVKNAKNLRSSVQSSDMENPADDLLSRGVIKEQAAFSSIFHYFLVKMCCIRRKKDKLKLKQQEEGLELAKKKINVLYIIKKLEEFEKLKYVLLDEKQRALFDYIPQPLLTAKEVEDEKRKKTESELLHTTKYYDPSNELRDKYRTPESIRYLYEVYRASRSGDPLSRKLVDMLGYRVLAIFKFMDTASKSDSHETKIKRLKGVRRAAEVFRQTLARIRERKLIQLGESTQLSESNRGDDSVFLEEIAQDDCKKESKVISQQGTPDKQERVEEEILLKEEESVNKTVDQTIDHSLDQSSAQLIDHKKPKLPKEFKEKYAQTIFEDTPSRYHTDDNTPSSVVYKRESNLVPQPRLSTIALTNRPSLIERKRKKK